MNLLTPDQAKKALDQKLIDQETFARLGGTATMPNAAQLTSAITAPPTVVPKPPAPSYGINSASGEELDQLAQMLPKAGSKADEPVTLAAQSGPKLATDRFLNQPTAGDMFESSGYNKALETLADAELARVEASRMQAEAEEKIFDEQIKVQQEADANRQIREIARAKQLEAKTREIDEAVSVFEDAEIDPGRLYANSSTASKIVGAISLALGAFGAPATGGENRAASIIRDAIDKDVALQKADIAKMGDVVTAKRNLLQDMRVRFDDERQAEAATKIALINNAELQLKQVASQYKGKAAAADALKTIGTLQLEKEKLKAEFAKQFELAQLKGGGRIPDQYAGRYVEGYGLAPSDAEGKELRAARGIYINAEKSIDELLGMVGKGGAIKPEMKAKANVLTSILKGAIREAVVGPGALTENDQKILDGIVANPTDIFALNATQKAALTALKNALKTNLDAKAAGLGMRPTGPLITFTPEG